MSISGDRRLSRGSSLLGEEMENNENIIETKNKEGNNEMQELDVPAYIIYYILTYLRRVEVHKCGLVSKQWKKVASDSCFGWISVIAMPLLIDHQSSYEVLKHTEPVDYDKIELVVGAQTNSFYDKKFRVLDKKGNEIISKAQLGFMYGNTAYAELLQMIENCDNHPRVWRCEVMKRTLRKKDHYWLLFEINIREAEKLVEKKEMVMNMKALTYAVNEENKIRSHEFIRNVSHSSAHIPVKATATQKQPAGLVKTLKLYKYQLDAVSWLKSVEEDIDTGFEYTDYMPWRSAKTTLLFPKEGQPISVKDVAQHKVKVYPKGGVLADEMGLGKTTEIIGLILSNPGDPSVLGLQKDEENESEKDKEKEKEKVIEPVRPRRAKATAPTIALKNILNQKDLFVTNATLVICPGHLIKQWHEEIEKTTRPHLNVISLTNVREIKGSTYGDIVNADVVLVTFQMLSNDTYLSIGHQGTLAQFNKRIDWINDYLSKIWTHPNPLEQQRAPVLEHFLWRRIVVDEAHEHISEFSELWNAKYFWYVSGTPYPNPRTVERIVPFLRFPPKQDHYDIAACVDIYVNNLYWRNTKDSVKNEYTIPPIVEDLVLLDFNPLEKEIYKWFKDTMEMSIITYYGLVTSIFDYNGSLTTIRTNMIAYLKLRIHQNKDAIKKIENQIADNQKRIKTSRKSKEELKTIAISYPPTRNDPNYNRFQVLKSAINCTKSRISAHEKDIILKKEDNTRCEDGIVKFNSMPESTYKGRSMASAATIPGMPEEETIEDEKKENENENQNKENNEDEEVSQETLLPASVIVDMNLAQVKEALTERGIQFKNNQRKADLQKILKEAVKNNVKPIASGDKKEKGTGKGSKRKAEGSEDKPAKKKKVSKNDDDKKRTTEDKIHDQNVLKWLIETHGTKIGNILFYLKNLWSENPSAKLIFFSQYQSVLKKLSAVLLDADVDHVILEGNIQNRVHQMRSFKRTTEIRALLLDSTSLASGTNIIEATHIVFLEPQYGSRDEAKATDDQAIARAYRQGQTVQVTVVRFVVRDTAEYTNYVNTYGAIPETGSSAEDGGRPKMQRTSSLGTALATAPTLTPAKALNLLEGEGNLN